LEASALNHSARLPLLVGFSPHLRLQRDERLIALVRRGHEGAFEALVQRYQPRLLSFCRNMLGSVEDAEDVLQEVFASAYGAIRADDRPINARPWLYRIARNRCLNQLRAPVHSGQDSMDTFERDGGATTAETVQRREDFRLIVSDVRELPETQRSALLLREVEALTYDQIAHAMDTTVPAVKSLLVRARVSLAEAAEARTLTCGEVRLELGSAAEGLSKPSAPARRHVKSCDRCRSFKRQLRQTSRAFAAAYPVAPLLLVKKLLGAKLGGGAVGSASAAGGSAGGGALGSAVTAAVAPLATKGVASVVAAAIVTAGAVEVDQLRDDSPDRRSGSSHSQDAAAERSREGEARTGERLGLTAEAEVASSDRGRSAATALLDPIEPRARSRGRDGGAAHADEPAPAATAATVGAEPASAEPVPDETEAPGESAALPGAPAAEQIPMDAPTGDGGAAKPEGSVGGGDVAGQPAPGDGSEGEGGSGHGEGAESKPKTTASDGERPREQSPGALDLVRR
jgi:RNA polymerase sigma factor (sigma-70 family)